MLIVGTEWLIEAAGCDAGSLRDAGKLRAVFARAVAELELKVVGEQWHEFDGAGGVTGLALLTESHLACHTYPEFRTATFNLYCCRARPRWPWEERLAEMLGASRVTVRAFERRASADGAEGVSPEGVGADEGDGESLPAREDDAKLPGLRGGGEEPAVAEALAGGRAR
jgi:S-adenosylmethionine decarboxylase